MAITLSTAARNGATNGIVDLADAGAGAGKVQVSTTQGDYVGAELLVEIAMDATNAFGASATGTASGTALPKTGTAVGTGTAAFARLVDSDDNELYEGTCGTSGTDFIIDNPSIASGQDVNLTAISYTTPAS
ncbi:MAG: hypothetical protein GY719_10090 [bacterium]|nr:hypothetical protein [bacterium]